MDILKYQYQPLNTNQIRILRLAPGSFNDDLLGDLEAFNLDDENLDYDALSYTWGDFTPTSTIHLPNSFLPLTQNLALALHYLRLPSQSTLLWIDAICINQSDLSERAAQVQLMRQVFHRASTVRSWIHEPSVDEASPAIQALQSFRSNDDESAFHGFEIADTSSGGDAFWELVNPIFRNAYWSRAWVQQEVLNARSWRIHVKHTVFTGEAFDEFFHAMYLTHRASIDNYMVAKWLDLVGLQISFSPITIGYRRQQSRPLIDLLRLGWQLRTTDPRDRVYALMHSAEDYVEGGIVPDYGKGWAEVACDAARYHMRVHGNVEFLVDCRLRDEEEDIGDEDAGVEDEEVFPSWIPPSWLGKSWVSLVFYLGGGYAWGNRQPDSLRVTEWNRLRLRAMRVDVVKHVLTRDLDFQNFTLSQLGRSTLIKTLLDSHGLAEGTLSQEAHQLFTQGVVQPLDRGILGTALSQLYRMCSDPLFDDLGNLFFRDNGKINSKLLPPLSKDSIEALTLTLNNIDRKSIVLSEDGKLGIVPKCDIVFGDEVWVVLGCALPMVFRRIGGGEDVYRVVCAVGMPKLLEDETLGSFDANVGVGGRVGDFVVEEIQVV